MVDLSGIPQLCLPPPHAHSTHNSKHKGGSVGLLTDGAVGRTEYYEQTVSLALIPHKNPELYFGSA